LTAPRRASLLAVALALALPAACEATGDGRGSSGGTPETAPTIVAGGSVTFGVYGEPATLDPYSPVASDLTYALARPLYRSLYTFTPDGEAVPDLVADLDVSGEVATIGLASARWSDGRAITSRDVAATIARARPPSGLARIDTVSRRGPRRVVVSGRVVDWPETLARISFVLPANEDRSVYSGPFELRSRVPGLQMVLTPNPGADEPPHLDRVVVRFTEGLEFLIGLLEDGRLDAAWLPSSVNLAQRLDEMELQHAAALGWERIFLDLSGADLAPRDSKKIARVLDRAQIQTGFIRDAGRISDTLHPEPGVSGTDGPYRRLFSNEPGEKGPALQLSAPIGDELLELIQRLVQVQLDSSGFDVELVNVDARRFYGEWAQDDPVEGAFRRAAGAPGWRPGRAVDLGLLPLFHVETALAWRDPVQGIGVNPTIEGPLWNAETWHLTAEP